MTKFSNTKRALVSSILVLAMCFSALVGTTFAWFTDSVTSSENVIQTGTLEIGMYWVEATEDPSDATLTWNDAATGPIFNNTYWEPGRVEAKHVKIANEGSLSFKYKLVITPLGEYSKLADVIDVYFVNNATTAITRSDLAGLTPVGTLKDLIEDPDGAAYGLLHKDETTVVSIALKMQESAGNEYQDLSIGDSFAIQVLATQYTHEEDSFGPDYDVQAAYPNLAYAAAPVVAGNTQYELVMNIVGSDEYLNVGVDRKLGTATVLADSIAEDASLLSVTYRQTETDPNFTVESSKSTITYDITVSGIKPADENEEDLILEIYVGEGLSGVYIYHGNDPVLRQSYDPGTGYITFYSKSFSPYTIVYDTITVEPPAIDENSVLPVATVTEVTLADLFAAGVNGFDENGKIVWNTGLGFSTANPDQSLDKVFSFAAPHNSETVADCPYMNWACDFYVMVSEDLPEGVVTLGGNYGPFKWVGFDNPAVEGNTPIPLLGSVVVLDWTYGAIVSLVGEFYCGVAIADNDAARAFFAENENVIFTVMLRLTNPENENEYYDVNVVTYNFTTGAFSATTIND